MLIIKSLTNSSVGFIELSGIHYDIRLTVLLTSNIFSVVGLSTGTAQTWSSYPNMMFILKLKTTETFLKVTFHKLRAYMLGKSKLYQAITVK